MDFSTKDDSHRYLTKLQPLDWKFLEGEELTKYCLLEPEVDPLMQPSDLEVNESVNKNATTALSQFFSSFSCETDFEIISNSTTSPQQAFIGEPHSISPAELFISESSTTPAISTNLTKETQQTNYFCIVRLQESTCKKLQELSLIENFWLRISALLEKIVVSGDKDSDNIFAAKNICCQIDYLIEVLERKDFCLEKVASLSLPESNEEHSEIRFWEDPGTCRYYYRNWRKQKFSKKSHSYNYHSLATIRLVCPMKGCSVTLTSPSDCPTRVDLQLNAHWKKIHGRQKMPGYHQQLGLYRCLNCGHLINDDEQYPNSQLPSPISRTRAYYHKHHCLLAPRNHPCPVSGCSVTPFVDAWTLKTHLRVVHRKMRCRCRWPMSNEGNFCPYICNFRRLMGVHIMRVHFGDQKDGSMVAEEELHLIDFYYEEEGDFFTN